MKLFKLLILAVILIVACNNKENAKQKLILPTNYEIYNPYLGSNIHDSFTTNKNLKIFTLVDVSCSTCLLKLEKWDKFNIEINKYSVELIPICYSKDNYELLKFLFENNRIAKISIPLILDINEEFIKANKNLITVNGEFTALVDNENKIILDGNLIDDENIKNSFLAKIKSLN